MMMFEQIDSEETGISPSDATATKEGFLMKLDTTGVVKTWKKRWFALHGTMLLYYKQKPAAGAPPLGLISVLFANKIGVVKDRKKKSKPIFEVSTPEKQHFLQCSTEEAMNDWIFVLKKTQEIMGKGSIRIEKPNLPADKPTKQEEMQSPSKTGPLELWEKGKWKQRFFAISDGTLTEKKTENGKALSTIPLSGLLFEVCTKPDFKTIINCFEITSKSASRLLILKADTEQSMKDWLEVLRMGKALLDKRASNTVN